MVALYPLAMWGVLGSPGMSRYLSSGAWQLGQRIWCRLFSFHKNRNLFMKWVTINCCDKTVLGWQKQFLLCITVLKNKKWKKDYEKNKRIWKIRREMLLLQFLVWSEKCYSKNYDILQMPWCLKGMMYSVTVFGLHNRNGPAVVTIQLQSIVVKDTNLWIIFHYWLTYVNLNISFFILGPLQY
jgi:hypothetical protein